MNPVVAANSLRASEAVDSWQIRRGLLARDCLYHLRFEIDELELLVGRRVFSRDRDDDPQLRDAEEDLKAYPPGPAKPTFGELDFGSIMHLGIDGIRASLRGRVENEHEERGQAIRSFGYAVDGLSVMIESAAKMVAGVANSVEEKRQAELKEVFDSCWRLAHEPPQTFRDMLQLHIFLAVAIQAAEGVCWYAPGHVDRLLFQFFEQDVQAGRLDRDSAVELLACFFVLMKASVPSNIDFLPVMIGGAHLDQTDTVNELSQLCLEALKLVELPTLMPVICRTPETPPDLLDSLLEMVGSGNSRAMMVNDSLVQRELVSVGVSAIDRSWYFITEHGGVLPSGCSDPCCNLSTLPLCSLLLDEIFEQVVFGSTASDLDSFLDRFEGRLKHAVEEAVKEHKAFLENSRCQGRRPLQSVFTRECVQRAQDIDSGGGGYNWLRCMFAGFANFANSLVVVAREIYGVGGDVSTSRLTLAGLKQVLDADFEGFEEVRTRFLAHPKFGFGVSEADAMACRVVEMIERVCRGATLENGGVQILPGLFVGEEMGHDVGATPDGRLAGDGLSQGCQPWTNDDGERPDTLSLIRSGLELNASVLPAGCLLEIGVDDGNNLAGVVNDFMDRGGAVLCLNVER